MVFAEPEEAVRFAVVRGAWLSLTFVHWRYESEVVQALLPDGLTVDTYDGSAWVTMAPFLMADQRPPLLRTVGRLGTFPETNLRTYVRGPDGRDGLWFYSLDADNAAFVMAARAVVGAPYYRASLSIDAREDVITYAGVRRGGSPSYRLVVRPGAAIELSERDVWLTARWRAYTRHLGRLWRTPVTHESWPLRGATVGELEESLTAAAGLPAPVGEPVVHYSEGVRDVRIGLTRAVR
jgi:uncharacterized protein YqjF (DUF2071 family)